MNRILLNKETNREDLLLAISDELVELEDHEEEIRELLDFFMNDPESLETDTGVNYSDVAKLRSSIDEIKIFLFKFSR
ncbi:hypothetical protein [Endozoicomonas sp.]|uniref:hypothetical protein n=1 Tax=Endozoicomonas sp. TaxID=1892382 RepID=UPI00383AB452